MKTSRASVRGTIVLGLVAACFFLAVSRVSAEKQGVTPPSLDQALFDDLQNGSIDADIERELFGDGPKVLPRKETEAEGPLSQRRIDAWNDLLEQELGQAAVDEAQNPLLGISRSMRLAERLIDESESGVKTQEIQAEIIADLDTLLKQAKKKCQSCASPSQSVAQRKPTAPPQPSKPKEGDAKPKPAMTSNAQAGKAEGESRDMGEMMAVIKQVWGELPEAERQEMLQLSVEEFLPKYADLIERYFKRLAEDRKEPR